MKLITSAGLIAKARRFLSSAASIENAEEAADPDKLAKTLRLMSKRIADLEARVGPEAIDFEVNVGAGGATTSILHGFSSPVRWWVVTWTQQTGSSYPTAQPTLVQDASSTSDRLVLRSYKAGRAIVRVEPAGSGIDPGVTVGSATSSYGFAPPYVSGLRLTLTTAVPVTSADVTGATTIYLTPYLSGQIRTYYNSEWTTRDTAEVSLAIGTLTSGKAYDVFAYWSGSAVTLELSAAWASASARTDALAYQDGVLVKSSDHTRLYVGTFYTTSTTQTEDSKLKRFVWNMYNRVTRHLVVTESTSSWTYVNPNSVYRQARATAANCFEYVCGESIELSAIAGAVAIPTTTAASWAEGIGIDSTTVNSASIFGSTATTSIYGIDRAIYEGYPAMGYHKINWLEMGQLVQTWTFISNDGLHMSGMTGRIMA